MKCSHLNSKIICWKFGILSAAVITILSLFPQIHFLLKRGNSWNGFYVMTHEDELIYSAYVNALIDKRPRRSDPFTGQDDSPDAPLRESPLSIQFVPAYAIAIPARFLGATVATAFIVLTSVTAFAMWALVSDAVNNLIKLRKKYFGGWSDIATHATTCVDGDVLKVVTSGNYITCYHNGASRITHSSSDMNTHTKHGIGHFSGTTPGLMTSLSCCNSGEGEIAVGGDWAE